MHGTLRPGTRRWVRRVALVAVSAGLLVACSGKGTEVQVGTVGPVKPPAPAAPADVFQGEVAAVRVDAAEIVVSAHLSWAPTIGPLAEDRRVVVGPTTRWQPGEATLPTLQVGQPIQVKADRSADGVWRAQEIMLVDVD